MDTIVITGQTATGKTDLALKLAKEHNGELVNFDSRQIYKYLDIITGKDIPKSKIWLYDIIEPNQYFSSFDFSVLASEKISDIHKRGKTAILVGGTYFYLKHLLYGFDIPPAPANQELRKKLNEKTVEELRNIIKKSNPSILTKMNHSDINNPRRLIRKIEINEYLKNNQKNNLAKNIEAKIKPDLFIGIKYSKKVDLAKAIENRVKKRIEDGAFEEVVSVLKKGFKETDPGLKTIGYQEIIKYLKKEITKKEAIELWTIHEIQYAKRQYTFMKKDPNIKWREIL